MNDRQDDLGGAIVGLGRHLICWLRAMFLVIIAAMIISGIVTAVSEWIGYLFTHVTPLGNVLAGKPLVAPPPAIYH
jgi:hypothetical protein